jgi:hypothetical protein
MRARSMRPRFSVRVLLAGVALLAAGCYLLLVRPSLLAERFVAAVNARDFRVAEALLKPQQFRSGANLIAYYTSPPPDPRTKIVLIYAEVLPREWSDIWSFRRRVIFRVAFHDDANGRHIEWAEDTRLVAGFDGVRTVSGT